MIETNTSIFRLFFVESSNELLKLRAGFVEIESFQFSREIEIYDSPETQNKL